MQEGWPPVLAITDPTDGGNPAAHEHDFGTSATPKTVTLETNAPWKFTIDDATAYAKVIANSGGITAGATQSVSPYTPDQTPLAAGGVTFTPATGYTTGEYGTLLTASVTFATNAGGGATEATPKTVTFSREVPSRFVFLGYSLDAGVTVVPPASIVSPVALPPGVSSTVRLHAETNRDWFGKLDAAQASRDLSVYEAYSYVDLATITARSVSDGASYTDNADKTVYYGHAALADVTAFTVRQPPYTASVTGIPSTVPALGVSLSFTVTTNAPTYSLVMKAGSSNVTPTVSGLPGDAGVTGSLPGTWSKAHTGVSLDDNPGSARTITVWINGVKNAGSFTQNAGPSLYMAGPVTSTDPTYSNITCAAGYTRRLDGNDYTITGVDFSWALWNESYDYYLADQTAPTMLAYPKKRSNANTIPHAGGTIEAVPTNGTTFSFFNGSSYLYWLCEKL
jgi:hypothetical protein